MGLNNQGLIAADQAVGLTINTNSTIVNSGTLQANAGSALTLVRSVNNSGTILANGGIVNANAGFTGTTGTARIEGAGSIVMGAAGTVGNLVLNGTGSLALGTHNITVNSDYTNASFGTGNSFNPRANVSGTGQILAAGDVAQAITGTNVSNGNTANATLTIGNVRVGANTFNYTVANTGTTGPALSGALQTAVNGGNITDARLSGTGVTASNWGPVATGGSTGNLHVTFTTAAAGALAPLAGQVVHIGNNFENVADQNLNIVLSGGAAAYNLAAGNATPSPVVVANQRVGGTASQALTVTNTAPAGSFTEGLNASFVSAGGNAQHNAGSISLLAGGASNSAAMSVGVDTAAAGTRSGTVTVGYVSDGTGTSGLGLIGVGSQVINVSGNVYQVAQPTAVAPNPVTLANQRVGGTLTQALTISNTSAAPAGFQEGLNASFSGTTGTATAGGVITNLAQGATNSATLQVGVDTSSAGARSGTANLALASNGAISGLTNLALPSQTVTVSGNVYQVAAGAVVTAPLNFGTVQVGQAVSQNLVIGNIATGAAGFVEDLNASFGASGDARISGVGSLSGILAGTSSTAANGAMTVSVNTAAPGSIASSIGVNFVSAGAVNGVSNGLGTLGVGSASYGVSGTIPATVINTASPVINTPTIALGNVRVGDTSPTQFVSVTNQATVAPQAALNASISTAAPLTASGSFNLLLPGSTDNTSLQVGMNTATAGSRNGTATLSLVSDASNVGGCAPNCQVVLPSQNVNITGGVYQVAQPNIPASVNLGSVHVGGALNQAITIGNTNIAPAGFQEGLNVAVGSTSGGATGSGSITNLAAGGSSNAITVGLAGIAAGNQSGQVNLNLASNGTGTSGLAPLGLGSQAVTVNAVGYTLAQASVTPAPVTLANQRVGGTATQALTVANLAPSSAFTETLSASFGANSGNATNNGGAVSGLGGGASNNAALAVGVNTGTAGARSGTVTVNLASNEVGGSGLGTTALTPQVITVSGNVYQLAAGAVVTAPLNFGTVQVGQAVSQNLVIGNTATGAAGFVEDLNASFGASGDARISGSRIAERHPGRHQQHRGQRHHDRQRRHVGGGQHREQHRHQLRQCRRGQWREQRPGHARRRLRQLRRQRHHRCHGDQHREPGDQQQPVMTVSVNTAAPGSIASSIGVNFVSAGAVGGVSNGLGTLGVGSASYGVSGTITASVINTASPVINTPTIALGNVRVGDTSPTQFVSVTNQATVPPQAALNASISTAAHR